MTQPLIEIAAGGLSVEGRPASFPIPVSALIELWGRPSRWEGSRGTVVTWHDLGVYAHEADPDSVKTLCVQLHPEPDGPAYLPTSLFTGTLRIGGAVVTDEVPAAGRSAKRVARRATTEQHGIRVHAAYDGDVLEAIEMTPVRAQPPVPPDKYAHRGAVRKPLRFTDLNLKLAVVDELMYGQGVLEPRFALPEFVRWHDGRVIDLEQEGHRPIPEALAYFERLEIGRRQAAGVRELVVDAGNEIYRQLAPHWDGEDATFDIASWDDLALLPGLERIDFVSMTPDPETIAALRARGIEVDA